MSIKVDISDALKGLKDFERKQQEVIRDVVNEKALVLETAAKVLAPYKTGNLKSSIQVQKMTSKGMVAEVGSRLKYAYKQHETNRTKSLYLTKPMSKISISLLNEIKRRLL